MKCNQVFAVLLYLLYTTLQCTALSWPHYGLQWGRCPDMAVEQNFRLELYQGYWYEQAGYRTEAVEGDKRCVYAIYHGPSEDGEVFVENHGLSNRDNKWGGINGTLKFTDPSKNEGKLTVFFKFGWLTIKGPYWVLGTDYTSYSVVYSCENFVLVHYYTIWVLSRQQLFYTVSDEQEFFNTTNTVLSKHRISSSLIQKSVQSNCITD